MKTLQLMHLLRDNKAGALDIQHITRILRELDRQVILARTEVMHLKARVAQLEAEQIESDDGDESDGQ